VDGEYTTLEFMADMSATNVEEMNDLLVAVWVQDTTRKELFQSVYSDSTSVGVPVLPNATNVKVYPNPTQGMVFLAGMTDIKEVTVFNNMGVQVDRITNIRNSRIDLGTLSNGLYILKIQAKEGVKTARVNVLR
jgi:hypothetical protein